MSERAGVDCERSPKALSGISVPRRPRTCDLVPESSLGFGVLSAELGLVWRDPGGSARCRRTATAANAAPPAGRRHEAPGPAGRDAGSTSAPMSGARAAPAHSHPRAPSPDDLEDEMLEPLTISIRTAKNVAGDTVSWAQDRLMQAFPGAEEV